MAVSAPGHSSSVSKQAIRRVVAAGAALALLSSCSTRIESDAGGRVLGTVTHVSDGDTITVSIGDTHESIRLIGVDTPETQHPTKPVQCWGPEATQHTKSLLPIGTHVAIVRDVEARDRYSRLLAYIYRTSDNLFVNEELVRSGSARPYPFPPNTTYESDFAAAAHAAQQQRLGLWGHCER